MAYQHGPFHARSTFGLCDSYFVENHDDDDGVYAKAATERERQRNVARLRQKVMADELSQLAAHEYQADILEHMERMELETMPDLQSIEIQTEIQWYMRPFLLDFLLEAHHAFHLLPETLHLAVNILDRYCSRRVVYKRHYQLVGCASLLIAAKYGDRKDRVPTIRELKSMCCSLYEDDMFTQMEWHVLQTLGWIIGHSTVSSFLDLALTEHHSDSELEHMTSYLLELALYHKDFIPVRASVMARSALALARCILDRAQPTSSLWSAQYDSQVVLNLSNLLSQPSQALQKKYASQQLSSVSETLELFLARQAALAAQPRHDTLAMEMGSAQHHYQQQHHSVNHILLTPQTPQKPGYPHIFVAGGVLTPPITPDKDFCGPISYPNAIMLPRLHTLVPTPPPSLEQQAQAYYAAYHQQQQAYMAAPPQQFVP